MTRTLSSTAPFEFAGVRWKLGPDATPEAARLLLARTFAQLEDGAVNLRSGRRKELYRIVGEPSEPGWLLKVHRYDRGDRWHRYLRECRAVRELRIALTLRRRGIDTPVPYAAGEVREGRRLDRCYLLIPLLEGVHDLQLLWRERPGAAQRRRWIETLGRESRRLHDAGLVQEDYAPNNFLVSTGDPLTIRPIDFERARLRRRVGTASRTRMLAVLDRHLPDTSASDRLRFLRAYCGGDTRKGRTWWRRLARQRPQLALRDARRLRRQACRDGRRVHGVEWNGWRGWAIRDAPERAQVESFARTSPERQAHAGSSLRIESAGPCWLASGPGTRADAQRLWTVALLLWGRGALVPRPIACVQRDDRLRFWSARSGAERTLVQSPVSDEARRAAALLVDRLRSFGRIDPWLSPRKIAVLQTPDGRLRAQLLDPTAFRPGRRGAGRGLRASREFVDERLASVERLVGEILETGG